MRPEELIDRMVQRLGTELKGVLEEVRNGRVSAAALEGLIRERLWHVGGQALGVMLEAWDEQLAGQQPVWDHRTRTVVSLFGALDLSRARCRSQDGWWYPLDEALGLVGCRGWTAGVQEAVSLLACDTAFQTVSQWMKQLLGLSIHASTVQELAELAGRRAAGLPDRMERPAPDTLIVAVDGCQAPQRDGWHEVKMGTVYPKEGRGRKASGRGLLQAKEYLASLENCQGFGQALWRCLDGWGVQQVRRVVVMGDGAPWIWNLADLHVPGATEIVDFYHAVEHLWQAGEALWGDRQTSVATGSWVRHYRKLLREGEVEAVMGALERGGVQQAGGLSGERLKVLRLNQEYFRRNAGRMRYGRFRQMGLPIGTGAVEGACKHVVQSRFKRPGCRWSRAGLQDMLALKVAKLNGQWHRLWPHLRAA